MPARPTKMTDTMKIQVQEALDALGDTIHSPETMNIGNARGLVLSHFAGDTPTPEEQMKTITTTLKEWYPGVKAPKAEA
jgi:hypothetical protein